MESVYCGFMTMDIERYRNCKEFQIVCNCVFFIFSCNVSMSSIFTAPEIFWTKDGWVLELHLDFLYVQSAR
jgi:hypothetical protein